MGKRRNRMSLKVPVKLKRNKISNQKQQNKKELAMEKKDDSSKVELAHRVLGGERERERERKGKSTQLLD